MSKKIELEPEDFQAMIDRMKELEDENTELKEANRFLNDQAKMVNKRTGKKDVKSKKTIS